MTASHLATAMIEATYSLMIHAVALQFSQRRKKRRLKVMFFGVRLLASQTSFDCNTSTTVRKIPTKYVARELWV